MIYIATYRAGSAGYQAPHSRGTIDVWHDSKRYVYSRNRSTDGECRRNVELMFDAKVTGRAPSYYVE